MKAAVDSYIAGDSSSSAASCFCQLLTLERRKAKTIAWHHLTCLKISIVVHYAGFKGPILSFASGPLNHTIDRILTIGRNVRFLVFAHSPRCVITILQPEPRRQALLSSLIGGERFDISGLFQLFERKPTPNRWSRSLSVQVAVRVRLLAPPPTRDSSPDS